MISSRCVVHAMSSFRSDKERQQLKLEIEELAIQLESVSKQKVCVFSYINLQSDTQTITSLCIC